MPKIINAIYENGVFKPLEPVSLKEHEKVKLDINLRQGKNGKGTLPTFTNFL